MTSEEARKHESLDVAIVGAGAAGVGLGAVLADLGLDSYAILERGEVGASFQQWPEEMRLITPSFPSNSFGCRDLNAVTTDTSPAFALDREHPTGGEYAEYLQGVVEFHDLPVRTGVDVESVKRHNDGFILHTSTGVIQSRFVIWAVRATERRSVPRREPLRPQLPSRVLECVCRRACRGSYYHCRRVRERYRRGTRTRRFGSRSARR